MLAEELKPSAFATEGASVTSFRFRVSLISLLVFSRHFGIWSSLDS